jgi:hypothetical protein
MTIEGIPVNPPGELPPPIEPAKESQKEQPKELPVKEPARVPPAGSQVFSVRLAATAVPAFLHLVQLHFKLGHIPQPTESAYLQYLVVKDAEQMRDDIKKRRAAIAR